MNEQNKDSVTSKNKTTTKLWKKEVQKVNNGYWQTKS